MDRSKGVPGGHSDADPDVPASLVNLLQLDLQQYKRESFVGCYFAWVRNLGCVLDAEYRDQPKQLRQLLGIWCSYGPDCDHYRHHDRLAKPITQTQKDCSPAIAWIGNAKRIHGTHLEAPKCPSAAQPLAGVS